MTQLDYGTAGYQGLSYSRQGTFHVCARKYQIENAFGLKTRNDSVTFAFGHAVAGGIQKYFETGSEQAAVIETAYHYSMPWEDMGTTSEQRGKKNLWYAILAVQTYIQQINSILHGDLAELQEYELAYLSPTEEEPEGKPAVELQFRIELEHGFVYEGHIDLIIRHKKTGEYAILELKTTTFRDPNEAIYGKSGQALSYSIVLDHVVGHANASYKIFYLVWSSSQQKFFFMPFNKQAKQRLDWINNLIRDTEIIQYYQASAEDGIPYPTNGASCFNFFRQCEYYSTCEMEDETLLRVYGKGTSDEAVSFEYQDNTDFIFTLDDIINTQVDKIEHHTGLDLDNGTEHGNIIEV